MSNDGSDPYQSDPNQSAPGQPDPYAAPEAGQPSPGQQPDPYATPQQPNPYADPPAAPYGGSHAAAPDPYAQRANPYGEPAPYGGSPQGGPGGAPYVQPAQAANPANPYAGADGSKPTFIFGGYASWGSRVVAYLIDALLNSLAAFPLWIGYGILVAGATTTTRPDGTTEVHMGSASGASVFLMLIGAVTYLAFFIWNQCLRQGRTGATLGKSVMAIRVVHADMQPIGGGLSFVRYLLNIVNGLPCYLGYLWPLWDARNQTFADKIMTTYVIKASEPQPRVY